ncbi:hypothetical protein H0A61_01012 [Koleobacter methoxysyntrophicus]|uniref:Uncharacterized protein n=1 Tax=Koleobacter methoxysyntrophicus TaxID=2751313 RepID=A0A8A0RLN2_9FIRM|nr:hypothetical protein H0A61_01012 [Koleobacter methoxysyntrophicus]
MIVEELKKQGMSHSTIKRAKRLMPFIMSLIRAK